MRRNAQIRHRSLVRARPKAQNNLRLRRPARRPPALQTPVRKQIRPQLDPDAELRRRAPDQRACRRSP